jgi:hypothetical protein
MVVILKAAFNGFSATKLIHDNHPWSGSDFEGCI